jgi:hypothetical protein
MIKNIEYCVRSAMFYLKLSTDRDYAYLQQVAKRYYTEVLPQEGLQRLGVYYGRIDHISRLALPDDYVTYLKVGVLVGNRIWTLSYDPTLALKPVPPCLEQFTNDEAEAVGTAWDVPPYISTIWGAGVTNNFAGGGAYNLNYYRIDEEQRMIYFDGTMVNHMICLEYISNGINVTGDTRVIEAYVNVLIDYLIWQQVNYDGTVPAAEKERREKRWFISLQKANLMAEGNRIDEVLDALYLSSGDRYR